MADVVSDSQFLRFMREIEVQGRLDHPNIARVHNALHFKSSLILVMELVEGRSLEKLFQTGGLSIRTAIDYIRQTLSGLAVRARSRSGSSGCYSRRISLSVRRDE